MPFEIGAIVGAYRIEEKLGSGGMATVYRAHQPRLDRDVSIKVMHQTIAQDPNFLARFEREARIIARLDHPNIVPIYDYADLEGQPFLVMKYVEGDTLKRLLERQPLSLARIIELMAPIATALDYAHDRGILHRDIKPSNVLIDERGIPYLTDFGLARIVQSGESTMSADVMLGTPHYISPEQAQGKTDLDPRTDVYSFGVVLYEMAAGRVPFVGDTSYAIIHDQIYTPPPPPEDINPKLSGAVADVLLKALEKNRERRYERAGDLMADFARAVSGEAVNLPPRFARGDVTADSMVRPRTGPGDRGERKTPLPPVPPRPPDDPPAGSLRGIFSEVGREIRQGLSQAGVEISEQINMERLMWRPGAQWTTGPDGRQGFYTKDELQAHEASLPDEQRIRRQVEKRIEERNDFYSHLAIYVAVNAMLWTIWAVAGGGFPWPIFPTMGWGIGIVAHYVSYWQEHGPGRLRRDEEIEREIRRERERMLRQTDAKPKNDAHYRQDADRELRLTQDGELADSFIEDYYEDDRRGTGGR
ncbi:MAG: protein kinase domain-containing protein [Chloroflexota bacterium]